MLEFETGTAGFSFIYKGVVKWNLKGPELKKIC